MKKKIRLYRKYDRDLISLYKNPHFSLSKAMSIVVRASAHGETLKINLPDPFIIDEFPKKIEFTIDISNDDVQTINWFENILDGTRNDAVKAMFRSYLCGPVLCGWTGSSDKNNILAYNQSAKQAIDCIKKKKDIIDSKKQELAKIKDILEKNGETPESLLSLLTKKKEEEAKEEIDVLKTSSLNSKSKTVKAKNTDVTIKKTEPDTVAKSIDYSKPVPIDESESDFDLFGAVDNMMSL